MENITREVRIRRMRKEVVGCVHIVVGKKMFLIKFEYGQKKEISSSSLVYLSWKDDVDMEEPIPRLPKQY